MLDYQDHMKSIYSSGCVHWSEGGSVPTETPGCSIRWCASVLRMGGKNPQMGPMTQGTKR